MKNKILFLDMDGVVNSDVEIIKYMNDLIDNKCYTRNEAVEQYKIDFCNMTELIFPVHAKLITKICEETNCNIVWTTTWRLIDEYEDINAAKEMLSRRGIPGERLIDYTPNFICRNRSSEIKEWLNINGKEVTRFAILDDDDYAKYNTKNGRFFQTSLMNGLTEDIAQDVIKWLND